MPIDAVKLDRSFVSDLTTGRRLTVSMVRSVLAIAEALNLRVDELRAWKQKKALDILRALGC